MTIAEKYFSKLWSDASRGSTDGRLEAVNYCNQYLAVLRATDADIKLEYAKIKLTRVTNTLNRSRPVFVIKHRRTSKCLGYMATKARTTKKAVTLMISLGGTVLKRKL